MLFYVSNVFVVCKNWKVLDMRVAGWLLNPDQPPKNFNQFIECTELRMVVKKIYQAMFIFYCFGSFYIHFIGVILLSQYSL